MSSSVSVRLYFQSFDLTSTIQPVQIAYRNKDEFSIYTGVDGNPKTVGFYVGKPTDPLMACVPPTYLINTKKSHKDIAQVTVFRIVFVSLIVPIPSVILTCHQCS